MSSNITLDIYGKCTAKILTCFFYKASTCEKSSEVDSKKEVFVQVLLTYVTQAAVVSTF